MLGRDTGGKFIVSVSRMIFLTLRIGPANPGGRVGIVVVQTEDKANIYIFKFSLKY